MKADRVHAVLAAGVQDPRLLLRWAADPPRLQSLGVDPASLDLSALRGFAGLAMKVRHNGLRDSFVHSFRLLSVAGLEIEFFADYALTQAAEGQPLAAGNEARAVELIDFLRHWQQPQQPAHRMLWDLMRHEQALLQLAQPPPPQPAFEVQAQPTAGSVPLVRGALQLHEMQHDPRAIVQVLRQRVPELGAVTARPCALGYWRPDPAAPACIVELDAFGFALLQAADGRRSVATLSAALGLGRRPPARMLRLLVQLQDAGLLVFRGRKPPTLP